MHHILQVSKRQDTFFSDTFFAFFGTFFLFFADIFFVFVKMADSKPLSLAAASILGQPLIKHEHNSLFLLSCTFSPFHAASTNASPNLWAFLCNALSCRSCVRASNASIPFST